MNWFGRTTDGAIFSEPRMLLFARSRAKLHDQHLDGGPRLGLTCRQMARNESGHTAPHVERERDPLGMINGEGIITGTVVWARRGSLLPFSERRSFTGWRISMLGPLVTPSNTGRTLLTH